MSMSNEELNRAAVPVNGSMPTRPGGVITSQPVAAAYRDWHDGLCSCGNDCGNSAVKPTNDLGCKAEDQGVYASNILWVCQISYILTTCVLTALFYPCMVCHMYHKYGECCATPLIVPMSPVILNVKHRSLHHITGSIAGDCCVFFCCGPCALCRLYRDMNNIQATKGSLD